MIENIKTEKLYPHPDNPRLDVGDVSELAESIKANGVMQNLTVIKGGKGVPEGAEGYTVIIGHRRLAAAKVAELVELPCSVVEMSDKDQIATMLFENMQRSDLTIYEQAQGMQMMIELGETQTSIAEKTGLSQSTVSKRLKVATLDKSKLKAAEERGGTLFDYLKAAEIKDPKKRNKVIDAIGTNNFAYTYQGAKQEQIIKEKKPIIKKDMKKIGATVNDSVYSWSSGYEKIYEIPLEEYATDKLPKKLPEKDLVWNIQYRAFGLYKKIPKQNNQSRKLSEKEKKVRRANRELGEINRQAYSLRKAFVNEFTANSDKKKMLTELIVDIGIKYLVRGYSPCLNIKTFYELVGQEDNAKSVINKEKWQKIYDENPGRALLALALTLSGGSKDDKFYYEGYHESMPTPCKKNDRVYEILELFGYQKSDMEIALLDGTHPAYLDKE